MLLKIRRQLTCFFPVSEKRKGQCRGCGTCCKIVFKCPFLKVSEKGSHLCRIYKYRFLSCKKYPRTNEEFVTKESCGFKFIIKPE